MLEAQVIKIDNGLTVMGVAKLILNTELFKAVR